MKLLTVTNLYPGEDYPQHGLFVEERLRQLVNNGSVTAEVIALRPGADEKLRSETRSGIDVHYLSVPTLRMVTNWIDPFLWSYAMQPLVKEIAGRSSGDVLIDGHFLYPDGAAATLVATKLGLPVVLTARGSDVNVKCENVVMRQWIRWAARNSASLITVSEALRTRLIKLGIESHKVKTLRNGVDLEKFSPGPGDASESRSPISRFSLLSVGHLSENKGHHLVIDALRDIEDAHLAIIGRGPDEQALRQRASEAGVGERVQFVGQVPHGELAGYYRAADVTVLASAMEGMPNVVLESLSCGTRVIATDVGGVSEVVTSPVAGYLLAERTVPELVKILTRLRHSVQDRSATRQFAVDNLGWAPVIKRQIEIYDEAFAH